MKSGWQTKKLGELCSIELGKTPARANSAFWDEKRETDNVWLSIADLLQAEDSIVVDSKEYLSDQGAQLCKSVPAGTLLVSFKLTLGRLAFAGRDLFTNEAIAALSIFNEQEVSKRFLFYFLHFFDWMKAAENDVKLKGMTLNKAKLKEIPVRFPAAAEQQRIVDVLDEAFAALATTKANAQRNRENARAIFESKLQASVAARGPEWIDKPLGDFCSFENGDRGRNYPSRSVRTAEGVPFINAGHLTDDGIDLGTMEYIPRERFDLLSNGKIREGDILFCLRGSLGKFASVGDLSEGAIASSLVIVRPDETVLNDFLIAYLRSPLCSAMIERFKSGTAQPNLAARSLSKFIAPVPPLVEQRTVVERLARYREETQHLADIYRRKLASLDALKQSLLHQAFTGQLGEHAT